MAQLHYGDQEARRQAADAVDHDDAMKLQGEGYGVQAHHGRNDPFTADKESPADVSAGYGDLEAKQEDGSKASPTSGYGNHKAKQEDAGEALPISGYGGQPNQVTMPKHEGYTSLGLEESQDDNNSENSLGVPSEEGINMKNREGSPPHESIAKERDDRSATGGGIIDVNSLKKDFVDFSERNTDRSAREREGAPNGILGNTEEQEEREGAPQGSYTDEQVEREGVHPLKEDYVDLSEGNTNELKVDDPMKASHADTSQITSQIKSPIDDPKQRYSVEDPKQEISNDDSSKQKDSIDATKQESPIDVAKLELSTASPDDDDTHVCESFQGDDGKEIKIKVEGYNIYSGEPEKTVVDAAEVLGDQQYDKPTRENEVDTAIKPHEDLSAQEESSPEAIKDVPKQVSGFDIMESEQVSVSDIMENEQARAYIDEHKEPITEHVSSLVEQDAGFKLDPKYREEVASERESAENVPANEESPYTEFNHTNDYVKAGYGAEGFVPKRNEDVDKELRESTEKVYQEEQRRPTDENPLVKQEGNGEMAFSEDTYGSKEGNVKGISHCKDDDDNINNKEIDNIDVPMRPPSLPHPRPEDLAEEAFNDDGKENHEGPHKKGVFEKIKDKLSPHFTST